MTDYPVAISALQHYCYCPRQFALIHIEQVWADNYFTAQGNVLHERVDGGEPEQRDNVRFERSVAVLSERYGLQGKLDLLEIEKQNNNLPLRYFPVEYKRGKHKVEDWDRVQLCAQALCLEEMRGLTIEVGAIWYWQERKREAVAIDEALRQKTINIIELARNLLQTGKTPPPTHDKKRCKACSLVDLCEPDRFRNDKSLAYVNALFEDNKLEDKDEGLLGNNEEDW